MNILKVTHMDMTSIIQVFVLVDKVVPIRGKAEAGK